MSHVLLVLLWMVAPLGAQRVDLTGVWQDDVGKEYRVRQVNNQVFWHTESSVFHGTLKGQTISGEWADLPGAKSQGAGRLTLRVESNDRLVKNRESGAYAGAVWTRRAEAATPDLVGEWRWSCCGGQSGAWHITSQAPDGTFSGAFSAQTPQDVGAIEGRIQGNQVEFTRRGAVGGEEFKQRWAGTLSSGRLEGRLEHGEFTAQRWVNLVCEWRWSCCNGQFFGTWRITSQTRDGAFSGAFSGKTAEDIGSIEGRIEGNRVEFIRRGAVEGQSFEQRWTGTVSGNKLKGRLEAGEFAAECISRGGPAPGSGTGSGGGICFDPQTLAIMDEWLERAVPPQEAGESLRYESWGRVVGQTRKGPIEAPAPPETPLSRCDWLWFHSPNLRSANGLGTLREYVDQRRHEQQRL